MSKQFHIADVFEFLNERVFILQKQAAIKRNNLTIKKEFNEIPALETRIKEVEWIIRKLRKMEQEPR